MENTDNKPFAANEEFEQYEFKHSFVDTPWDDRTKRSKIGIIALLLAIFVGTAACVINSFFMHYEGFAKDKVNSKEYNCQMVKMEDYSFAARILSVESKDMLCVGALVSDRAVLATGACTKSGPIRLFLGSISNPRCKKGFSVDVVEPINHDGVTMSKKMVVLYSYENIAYCATDVIRIGHDIRNNSGAHIIGRTMHGGWRFSRQPVMVVGNECQCSGMKKTLRRNNSIICVKSLARCPVLAGDLLIQDDKLYGLASTSVRRRGDHQLACFASLKLVEKELKELDILVPIDYTLSENHV